MMWYNFLFERWYLVVLPLIIIIIIVRVNLRGYFWEDVYGNPVTIREFFRRWGKGIEGITPLQQTRTSLMGVWITITGIISGMIVGLLVRIVNVWWWMEIILFGSLIMTVVQAIGTYQKYRSLKIVDDMVKQLENDNV